MQLISVWISSTDSYSERRLTPHLTIAELKCKLQPITGIPVSSQRLALNCLPGQPDNKNSILLQDENLTLLDYGVQDGATIDVVDTDPRVASQAGQYNDVSQVEKFQLPREEYEKRSDSLLAFKMRNKLGRFNPSNLTEQEEKIKETENQEELSKQYPLGSRCQVTIMDVKGNSAQSIDSTVRGTLRFVGPVEFNKKFPFWIGIELDEPSGKNDGSVDGHRYFTCPTARGIFVQPNRIQIGHFPPIDPLEDEEF